MEAEAPQSIPTYECDKCGACCVRLVVEIDELDIIREPRLKEVADPIRLPAGMTFEEPEIIPGWGAGAMLACGATSPCKLLGADNLCAIYPTRPNCCVALQPGTRLCQQARGMAGLEPLQPLQPLQPLATIDSRLRPRVQEMIEKGWIE